MSDGTAPGTYPLLAVGGIDYVPESVALGGRFLSYLRDRGGLVVSDGTRAGKLFRRHAPADPPHRRRQPGLLPRRQ